MGNPSSLEARIKRLELMAQNAIRVGKVAQLDAEKCWVRVTFPDRENVLSHWLRVMVHNTKENKDYWMPDLDEDVICVFLSTGMEAGFVLGSYYPEPVARPAGTEDVRCVEFADGGRMEYNRKTGHMLLRAVTSMEVDCPHTHFTGLVTSAVDFVAEPSGGISLVGHGHIEQGDGGRVSNSVP